MTHGNQLRDSIAGPGTTPLIGVYDMYSASIAAKHYDGMFVSGFGFAASYYGLPDIGFIAWPDMVAFVQRLRGAFPHHHLLVDIDDGYVDPEVACHVVEGLERIGASGVILEDQKRPRRCGHYDGKQLMELDAFMEKLVRVLETRRSLFVIARTDSSDPNDIVRRTAAFAAAGADGILVDGLTDLRLLEPVRAQVGLPLAFNQIAGGKSPLCTLDELARAGISIAIYSTPCLFAAQRAITATMESLIENGGLLVNDDPCAATVRSCTAVLSENLPAARARPLPAPARSAPRLTRAV